MVRSSVEKYLSTIDLDELGQARAAIALTVASKLDATLTSEAASVALAVAGMSKELRECLAEIADGNADAEEFLSGLFAPMGDATNP